MRVSSVTRVLVRTRSTELKEVKEDHKKALDKLNVALAFNKKLEACVSHTEDVVNKASVRAQFNKRLKETLRAQISSVIF